MRTHLMKHLKSRSPAIRSAIRTYNIAAKAMEPPRPALKAKEVMEHSFIGQFDVLRDSRYNIHEKDWANPVNCIARDAWYRTEGAKDKLPRLDVEVTRLCDWMRLEEAHHTKKIAT